MERPPSPGRENRRRAAPAPAAAAAPPPPEPLRQRSDKAKTFGVFAAFCKEIQKFCTSLEY